MIREKLPTRRAAETVRFIHRNDYHDFGFSRFPDGRVAEVFAYSHYGKGAHGETEARDASIILSVALQHGTPLATIAHAITRDDKGAAAGIIGAVVDAIMDLEKNS